MKPTYLRILLRAVSFGKPPAEVTESSAHGNFTSDRSGYFDRRLGSSASTGNTSITANQGFIQLDVLGQSLTQQCGQSFGDPAPL